MQYPETDEARIPETKSEKIPYQDSLTGRNRHRLPDKIMKCLDETVAPDVIWWSPHGNGFTVDSDTVQEKLLDVHFRGTKLASLVRSLNRWGFRRDFYRNLPRSALAFQHPQFKRNEQHLLRELKIISTVEQGVPEDSSDEEGEVEADSISHGEGNGLGAKKPAASRSPSAAPPNELRVSSAHQQVISGVIQSSGPHFCGFQRSQHPLESLSRPQQTMVPSRTGPGINPQTRIAALTSGADSRPDLLTRSSVAFRNAANIQHGVDIPIASLLHRNSILESALLQQRPPPLFDSADNQTVDAARRSFIGLTGPSGLPWMG